MTTGTGRMSHSLLLIQHRRFREAESNLRQELAASPQNAGAHALLALVLMGQDRKKDALQEAQQAVGLAPASPFGLYVMAMVLHHLDREKEAQGAVLEAIRLDPEDADYFALLSRIYLDQEDWNHALEAAQTGRTLDAENVECANLEAIALIKLGRKGEANQAIATALEKDPENAMTHANQGWSCLHQGQHEQALLHFREALRLNPQMEWARLGIIEGMKARNPIYKVILGYFLWMSRLTGQVRWGVIIGFYVFFRFMRQVARTNPELSRFLMPVIGLYLVFAIMTWTASPLFNLLLRLDRFGRMALSRDEIAASNWLGACVFGSLAFLAAGLLLDAGFFLIAAIGCFAMSVPVSGIFRGHSRKSRTILAVYAGGLALAGLLSLGLALAGSADGSALWSTIFLFGWAAYTWVANAILRI